MNAAWRRWGGFAELELLKQLKQRNILPFRGKASFGAIERGNFSFVQSSFSRFQMILAYHR